MFQCWLDVMLCLQGALFPAMHAILGQWAPPLERSFLGSMVVAGRTEPITFYLIAARLVAYWPARIHDVALPAYTVLT